MYQAPSLVWQLLTPHCTSGLWCAQFTQLPSSASAPIQPCLTNPMELGILVGFSDISATHFRNLLLLHRQCVIDHPISLSPSFIPFWYTVFKVIVYGFHLSNISSINTMCSMCIWNRVGDLRQRDWNCVRATRTLTQEPLLQFIWIST